MSVSSKSVALLILPILALFVSPAGASPLDAGQVRNLFSDRTVEYQHQKLGFKFVVYHSPDGSLRGTRNGQPMSELQWSVNDRGELCISYNQHNRCYPIRNADGSYQKYTRDDNGKIKVLVTYQRFIDGNPNDF